MLRAYHRWAGLPKLVPKPRPPGPQRARSSYIGELQSAQTKALQSSALDVPQTAQTSEVTAEAASGEAAEANKSQSPHEEQPDQAESKQCAKYLLVDDNNINLKVLSAFMKKLGHTYATASNGQEAVDAYTKEPESFAGIFMDLSMPVMDGLEATREIRKHERKSQLEHVAIIALTGLSSHRTHQDALDSGINIFLTKPVNLKTLTEALSTEIESPMGIA